LLLFSLGFSLEKNYFVLAGVISGEKAHIVLADIQWYTSSIFIRVLLQFLLFIFASKSNLYILR
jgi:hypothetical protein